MKNLFLFLGFVLFANYSFGQANKTYVKTVDPQMSQQINLKFDQPYEVEQWDEDGIRLLIDVKLLNASDKILEQLMLAGRYKITKVKEGDSFVLDIPGLKKEVTIKGQTLDEEVSLKIMVPRYTLVDSNEEEGLASVSIKRGLSPELAAAGVSPKFDPNFYEFDIQFNFETDDAVIEDQGLRVTEEYLKAEVGSIDAQINALQEKKKALLLQLERF